MGNKNSTQLNKMKEAFKEGKNIFLTGAAGTGKSFILKEFIKWARKYSKEKDLGKIAVTGSTGVAAINVGGKTIQSFFGLGITKDLDELAKKLTSDEGFEQNYNRKTKKLKEYKTIIIDEISMVGDDLLELIDTTLIHSSGIQRVFGGKQIIVVGDFFQLPPVNGNYSFDSEVWKQANFVPIILTDVVRQTDEEYMNILKSSRLGGQFVGEKVHTYMKKLSNNNVSNESTKLFSKNKDVEKINKTSLEQIEGETFKWKAIIEGGEPEAERLKKNILAPEIFEGKIGAKVMILKNDPDGDYVNGSLGFITDNDGKSIMVRLENNGKEVEIKTHVWESFDEEGIPLASYEQIPLRLAYAMTIHKSQGMTIEGELEVDFDGCYSAGQAYVALSRITDPKNLKVSNYKMNTIKSSPKVFEFYSNLVKEITDDGEKTSMTQKPVEQENKESTTTNPLINHPLVDVERMNELTFWNQEKSLLTSFVPKGQKERIRFFRGKPKLYKKLLQAGNMEEKIGENKESIFFKDGCELSGFSVHTNIGKHLLKIPSRSILSEIREPFTILPWNQVLVDDSVEYGSMVDNNLKDTLTNLNESELEETKLTFDYIKENTKLKWTHRSQMICNNEASIYGEVDDIFFNEEEDKYYISDLKTSSSADKKSYWYQLAIYIETLKSLNPGISHKISSKALIKWTRIKNDKRILHPSFEDKNEKGEYMNIAKKYEYNQWIFENTNDEEKRNKAKEIIEGIDKEIVSKWDGRDNKPTPNDGIYFMKWQSHKEPIEKVIINDLLEKDLASTGYLNLAKRDIEFIEKWNIKTVDDYNKLLEENQEFSTEANKLQLEYNNLI